MADTDKQTAEPGFAPTRDGTRIAYAMHARPDGGPYRPRLALVHSLAMNGAFWDAQVERLAAHVDVLSYDCRGHGASDKPAGPFTVEQFAGDLADLLDHVGWPAAAVAGASMGGAVALAFAATYPERTAALGLIDTTAWYGDDAAQKWAERADKAMREGLHALVDFQQTRWFSDAFRAQRRDVVDTCVATFLKNRAQDFAATCGMLGRYDLRAALPRLKMPVTIVVGEEDYATPVAMARQLHAAIPAAQFLLIDGARHLTPIECPDIVAGRLLDLAGALPT